MSKKVLLRKLRRPPLAGPTGHGDVDCATIVLAVWALKALGMASQTIGSIVVALFYVACLVTLAVVNVL